jgi:hypothetical protein
MTISTWYNALVPYLPGVPQELLDAEITRTVQDFCRRSTSVRGMIYDLLVIPGEAELEIETEEPRLRPIGVLRAYLGGTPLYDTSHSPKANTPGYPLGYTVSALYPLTITFSRAPQNVDGSKLDVLVYYEVADPSAWIPPIIEQRFFDAVRSGVLSDLMASPEKPYTNVELAMAHARLYRSQVQVARAQATQGFTSAAQNWAYPKYGS